MRNIFTSVNPKTNVDNGVFCFNPVAYVNSPVLITINIMLSKKLRLTDYYNLLTHVADRFFDFYIIYNHARLNRKNSIEKIQTLNECLIDIWNCHGYDDNELQEFNLIHDTWDCLQRNFSYDRILDPEAIIDENKKAKYKESANSLYEITNNEYVIAAYNDSVAQFNYTHWIRIADIIKAPSVLNFFNSFIHHQNKLSEFKQLCLKSGYDWELKPISDFIENINKQDLSPLFFYPERLRPGINYMIPDIDGANPPHSFLAIGCHYNADPADIQEAFIEYPYQLEKFKKFHFLNKNCFSDMIELEKLKPLIEKKVTDNKYISKFNSIEISLMSLFVWEKVNLEGFETNRAINEIKELGLKVRNIDGNKKSHLKSKLGWVEEKIEVWDKYYIDMNTK